MSGLEGCGAIPTLFPVLWAFHHCFRTLKVCQTQPEWHRCHLLCSTMRPICCSCQWLVSQQFQKAWSLLWASPAGKRSTKYHISGSARGVRFLNFLIKNVANFSKQHEYFYSSLIIFEDKHQPELSICTTRALVWNPVEYSQEKFKYTSKSMCSHESNRILSIFRLFINGRLITLQKSRFFPQHNPSN